MNYWVAPQFNQVKSMKNVLNDLCIDLDTDLIKLRSKSRSRHLADKRHIALYVLNKHLGLTTKKSGELLNRDHASVIHACYKVENLSLCSGEFNKYKLVTISDVKQIKNKY